MNIQKTIAMSVGLALGAASVLGNIFSNIMSSRQNNKVDDLLSDRMNDLQSAFDKDSSTNFLDTDQAKSVLKTLGNQHDEQTKKIDNASVVGGASQESKIAAKESAQDSYGDSVTKLAGYGTQYQDMKEREFNSRSDALNNFYLQNEMSKGSNWTNLGNNATNLGQTGILAGSMGSDSGAGTLMDLFGKNSGFGAGGYI